MADPYRTNPHASSSLESEDMSSFFLNFLQGTPASSSATAAAGFYNRSGPAPVAESSSSLNFSDPGRFYAAEFKEGVENVFASAGLGECDGMNSANRREFLEDDKVDNFGFSSEECDGLDMPSDPTHPRSSKRSRSAEVHNLSEKRRRSRINEKLKALQNLIPNSNKTDKASMLDEAIEYLKQLQLQVQMLTMRNGLNMYPLGLPRMLQQNQLSHQKVGLCEGNAFTNAKVAGNLQVNQDASLNAIFNPTENCTETKVTPPITMSNINRSDSAFELESSMNIHLDPFQLSRSTSKDQIWHSQFP